MWHIKILEENKKGNRDQFCKVMAVPTSLHGSEPCVLNQKKVIVH